MVELKNAKCPGCGGELKLNPAHTIFRCIFCDHEYPVEQAINLAKVDGIQTSDAAIERAYQKLEDNNPDGAMADFKHVIDLKPTCAEAHYGCFICALFEAEYYRHLNRNLQRNLLDYIDNINNAVGTYGKRAVQYASSDEERSRYQRKIDAAIAQAKLALEHIEYGRLGMFQRRKVTAPSALVDLDLSR